MGKNGVDVVIRRFDVVLAELDPAIGSEVRKNRPCLVVSPDEMNKNLRTLIIVPLTTGGISYPSRIPCKFRGKSGQVMLDQIRTIDKSRVIRRLGAMSESTSRIVMNRLTEMFTA